MLALAVHQELVVQPSSAPGLAGPAGTDRWALECLAVSSSPSAVESCCSWDATMEDVTVHLGSSSFAAVLPVALDSDPSCWE